MKKSRNMPLLTILEGAEPAAELPPMARIEQVFADYRTAGFSLKSRPIAFFRGLLDEQRVIRAGDLKTVANGRHIRVAGIVLLRQRPGTARGITFVTLEDETGTMNLIIRPVIWDRFYSIARSSSAWIAHGLLESKGP
jgi:error-prone DNA polymerase